MNAFATTPAAIPAAIPAALPDRPAADVHLAIDQGARLISCSIVMTCRPQTIYAVWSDVARWSSWDPDTRSAQLEGPFAIGSRGRLVPRKGLAVRMRVSEAIPEQFFRVVCPVLGNTMEFDHRIDAAAEGKMTVTHSVRFSGWLSALLFRAVGADVRQGLPLTMTRLRAHCQAREP